MLQVTKLKTVGRVAFLVFLLMTTMGPWFADTHPATEENCRPPFVWVGNGYCACLITFVAYVKPLIAGGENTSWLPFLLVALPVPSTLLLILIGERRWLWVCHLTAGGLAAICWLLWFVLHLDALILWGVGLGGVVVVAMLVMEILIARRQFSMNHREGF